MTNSFPSGQHSWVFAIAGVISILFGLAALIWPAKTVFILIVIFGIFAVADGIVSLFDTFRAVGEHRPWWPSLLIGIFSIVAGIYVLTFPGITAVVLLYAIAFWAIAVGLVQVVASLVTAEFLLLIVGIVGILFGFVLLGNPAAGALALVVVIGLYAIVRGIVLLTYAFRAPTMPALPT